MQVPVGVLSGGLHLRPHSGSYTTCIGRVAEHANYARRDIRAYPWREINKEAELGNSPSSVSIYFGGPPPPFLSQNWPIYSQFDFEAGPLPKIHEDWRLEDPIDAVLSTCSSLLVIVDVKGSSVIQFSHFSVKEFLTSARLAETHDIIPRRYHVSDTPAHTLAAQACLGILLHLDKDVVTSESLERSPLAKYAAEYWADHARLDDVSKKCGVMGRNNYLTRTNPSSFGLCLGMRPRCSSVETKSPS